MALKGKKLSEEHKRKISLAHKKLNKKGKCNNTGRTHIEKGQHLSVKTEYKKGQVPWITGKKMGHPWNFNSYSSLEPYGRGWTDSLKNSIRQRDNYKCQECGVPQEECAEVLHVHHKNAIKKDLNPTNLVSLCRSCHSKITKDMIIKNAFGEQ